MCNRVLLFNEGLIICETNMLQYEIEYEYSPTWTFFDYFKALYECNTVNNVLASCFTYNRNMYISCLEIYNL